MSSIVEVDAVVVAPVVEVVVTVEAEAVAVPEEKVIAVAEVVDISAIYREVAEL